MHVPFYSLWFHINMGLLMPFKKAKFACIFFILKQQNPGCSNIIYEYQSPDLNIMTEKKINPLREQTWIFRGIHIALLIIITSIVFSNTLDNTYHLDSVYRVKNNTEINDFWPPSRFFTDRRTGSTIPQVAEYRPMMPLSHAINSEIAKVTGTSQLAGFHVGNIAIHIASSILVYFLFCLLISTWGTAKGAETPKIHYSHQAFAAALIFAVHPIAGSAVNYIAGRDLLLMVFFFLAFMLVYFTMRRDGDTLYGWLTSLLLLCLAILSKQAAIVGFGMIFLFEWVVVGVKLRAWRLWARTILFGLPTAAYFLLRQQWFINKNAANDLQVPVSITHALRVPTDVFYPLTMAEAHLSYYLKNFVWPFEMRALAKFDKVDSLFDPAALAGLVLILTTLGIALLLRKRKPLISFAIFAYWLLFALTASIFPFRFVVTDYRQYLPLVFLSFLISQLCFAVKPRTLPVVLLLALTLYFSVSSYQINQHWKTEESFWRQSVKYGAVARAHQNYGLAIGRTDPELAETHYLEALRQTPGDVYTHINLGLLQMRMGKKEEGLLRLSQVVARNPKWALAYYWYSEGLKSAGKTEEALLAVKRAAELDPRSIKYQYTTAKSLQDAGQHSEAIPYFERVIKLNPDYRSTEFWLGFAYQKSGRSQDAIDTYNHFLEAKPDNVQAQFNLAYELMVDNDCEKAVKHFNNTLKLRPNYTEAHLYLSRCYRILGNESLAVSHEKSYSEER